MSEEAGTAPERLVPLGEIVGTHGVGGLLRFHPYSDSTAALTAPRLVYVARRRSAAGKQRPRTTTTRRRAAAPAARDDSVTPLRLTDDDVPLRLADARAHGRLLLLRFEGVATIDAATPLVGAVVSVPERELPAAAPGEFYVYQLEGLEVVTRAGSRLGTVDHLIPTGSNEVLVVRDGAREHLIPVIADVVREVDLVDRKIVIEPIEGLLD